VTHPAAGLRRSDSGSGRRLVVAVDGPSGSGKSSAARGVATALGLRYLDTGAMYRALTWWLLEHEVDVSDPAAVAGQAVRHSLEVGTDPGEQRVRVDGIDVTVEIRNRRVSNVVSLVASVPEVRRQLIAMQRQIIAAAVESGGGIVAEGRDIGTVVAPDADVKIFLTASEQVRAERRAAELAARQADREADPAAEAAPTTAVTRLEQDQRDRRDAAQTQLAVDAVEIDATSLGLDEVIARITALAAAKLAEA
jgi:cytidylate kinase